MPQTPYQKEATHERDVLKRYMKQGKQTIRSAGSHGLLDGVAWDNEYIYFVASRMRVWSEKDRLGVIKQMVAIPNSYLVFFELLTDGEHVYIYKYDEKNKYIKV